MCPGTGSDIVKSRQRMKKSDLSKNEKSGHIKELTIEKDTSKNEKNLTP